MIEYEDFVGLVLLGEYIQTYGFGKAKAAAAGVEKVVEAVKKTAKKKKPKAAATTTPAEPAAEKSWTDKHPWAVPGAIGAGAGVVGTLGYKAATDRRPYGY